MRDRSVLQSSAQETLATSSESRRYTVFTGGFPCQNISPAGKGGGLEGDRSRLWHDFFRIIATTRPEWIVIENHADLRFKGLEAMLSQLDAIGYHVQWHCIPSSAIGAPHERDRIWIIAHSDAIDGQAGVGVWSYLQRAILEARDRNSETIWLETSRPPPGVDDGLSAELDQRERTEGLGNAVIPQIAEIIANGIREVMK